MTSYASGKTTQKVKQTSPPTKGSVRSVGSFRFFSLPGPSSVLPFGLGISVDGSVGETLGILQLTDIYCFLVVGLMIPWSRFESWRAHHLPIFFIALWHWDKGIVHCLESPGPKRTPWESWGYDIGTEGLGSPDVWAGAVDGNSTRDFFNNRSWVFSLHSFRWPILEPHQMSQWPHPRAFS